MNKTVLALDDDSDILEVIRLVLEDAGYEVQTYQTFKSILELVEQHKPSVILVDMWMGDVSGSMVIKELRSYDKYKALPVVLVSGTADSADVANEAGADARLDKPFDIEALLNVVNKLTS